jgi:Fur family zinc uptake transcriptional regulator
MAHPVLGTFRGRAHDHDRCISDALDTAEEICGERGLRLTALRRRVLELVWSRHEPVRAYDLLEELRTERRRAAPPTVYRALEFLIENGFVHRIESLNAFVGCAGPRRPHAGQFLICRGCASVAELDDAAISRMIARKAQSLGFRAQHQTIEVTGLCPECGRSGAA